MAVKNEGNLCRRTTPGAQLGQHDKVWAERWSVNVGENNVWHLKDVSPDSAHQLGLMVANMIKQALDDAVEEASAANVAAFRQGILDGLLNMGVAIDAAAWFQGGNGNGNGKRKITATKVT